MKSTLMIFAVTGFFLTLWGFLPDVHRSAISIALLRPLTGLMCLLGIIAERRWAKLTFAGVGLTALGSVALHALPAPACLPVFGQKADCRSFAGPHDQ